MVLADAAYPILKLVHVLAAVFLLSHWLLLAVWKAAADRSGDAKQVADVADRIFRLDRQVTTPVALVAFAAGYVIIRPLGMFGGRVGLNGWAVWGLVLFFVAILAWLLVLKPMEARLADLADGHAMKNERPGEEYRRATLLWLVGVGVALAAGVAAAAMMVFKPVVWPS